MADRLPIRRGRKDPGWQEMVARHATPGDARRLTGQVLRAYPDLRLADVVGVIPAACAAGMPSPAPGQCQTIDAGLATIDARGPGWVDRRYPIDVVLPELAEAGFDAAHIVALFNGNVPIEKLGPAVVALFPAYAPDVDDEAIGGRLVERWSCPLRCCQPPEPGRLSRWARGAIHRLASRRTLETSAPAIDVGAESGLPAATREPPDESPRYRSLDVMRPTWARVGSLDSDEPLAAQHEFLEGAIFPEGLALFRPTTGPPSASAAVDVSLPAMLVILVDPDDIAAELRAVFDARAAQADGVAWGQSLRGQVGWTTLATVTGDPVGDTQASFAKLNLDLTAPMRYQASFVFHLGQTRSHVEAVAAGGGLLAFGMPELVQQLTGLTIIEAMDSLPFFILPAAPQLAALLANLEPPA